MEFVYDEHHNLNTYQDETVPVINPGAYAVYQDICATAAQGVF